MTAQSRPLGDEPFAPDPERALDAYADVTRIAASGALVRRFQAGVAQERAAQHGMRGRLRAVAVRAGMRPPVAAPGPMRSGTTFALRLQGLALLLLLVLAMGLVAGGAGAAILTMLDGPRRGSDAPAHLLRPRPSAAPEATPSATPAPTPKATPAPSLRVQSLAQRDPVRGRAAERRTRHDRATRHDRPQRPGPAPASCRSLTVGAPPAGEPRPQDPARPHAGRWTCAF